MPVVTRGLSLRENAMHWHSGPHGDLRPSCTISSRLYFGELGNFRRVAKRSAAKGDQLWGSVGQGKCLLLQLCSKLEGEKVLKDNIAASERGLEENRAKATTLNVLHEQLMIYLKDNIHKSVLRGALVTSVKIYRKQGKRFRL